jgi:hypothetical protein
MSRWIRQFHRWVAFIFVVVVTGIFIALGVGQKPVQWVYYVPLLPLGLLALSGVYLFVLPYAVWLRGGRRGET